MGDIINIRPDVGSEEGERTVTFSGNEIAAVARLVSVVENVIGGDTYLSPQYSRALLRDCGFIRSRVYGNEEEGNG